MCSYGQFPGRRPFPVLPASSHVLIYGEETKKYERHHLECLDEYAYLQEETLEDGQG